MSYTTLPPPLAIGIPPQTSHILSLLFTSSYVASIYISQHPLFSSTSTSSRQSPSSSPPPTTYSDNNLSTSLSLSNGNSDGIPPLDREKTTGPTLVWRDDEERVPRGHRDHPETIKLRMKAVGISTALSVGGLWWVVTSVGGYKWSEAILPTLQLLGIPTSFAPLNGDTFLPYLLAPILFIGPLYSTYLDHDLPFQSSPFPINPSYPSYPSTMTPTSKANLKSQSSFLSKLTSRLRPLTLIEWRSYIIAPLTEELVFRSTVLAVSRLGKMKWGGLVFGTPLWFGVAHAHHALETFRKNGSTRAAAIHAAMGCVFQLGYTTLFGWFASYLFVTTGSILPSLSAHIFCNLMGIYLPTTAASRHPRQSGKIWLSYGLGIVGFVWGLRWV